MFKRLMAAVLALFAAVAFAAVDVNKATPAELDGIKGIGPAIAGKIVEERKKGDFKDWQDFIDRVKGVGENNAVKLSADGLTVNGTSFKGVAAAPKAPAAKKDDKPAAAAAAPAPAPMAKKDDKAMAAPAAVAPAAAAKPTADAKPDPKAKAMADKQAKAEEKAKAKEEKKAKAEAEKKDKKDKKEAKAKAADAAASAPKK
jgi:competence protein ComEA